MQERHTIVAALRVKNESWIIDYTLSTLSEYVDKIVIVDDNSADTTREIATGYPKVVELFRNNPKNENDVDEARDWNTMTKLAIAHNATWILYLDADETIEPRIKDEMSAMVSANDVGMYRFRKISPWLGLDNYRSDQARYDSPASRNLNPVLVKASKSIVWHDGRGGLVKKIAKRLLRGERFAPSLGRGFPKGIDGKIVERNDLVCIHFNHLNQNRLLRKQVFYALVEKQMKPRLSREEIVNWVSVGWNVDGITLEPMNSSWLWHDYIDRIDL